jgi:tetratricopeptide (TPR) repeat protein
VNAKGTRVWPVLAIGALLLSSEPHAGAQSAASPHAETEAERQAVEMLENGLYVTARTRAERILRDDPDSIVGHFVLGRAYFDAEGSLARAMYHLGRARELHETRHGSNPTSPFHQELLYQTARLAGQMELYEFQLDLLGYHDHLYDPDLVAERCWPLMKLERTEEARRFATAAAGSASAWQRSAGLNALCAVEGEARTRQPYFDACNRALADARAAAASRRPGADAEEEAGIAVDAHNAALAALAALRFAEAEQIALEGARRFEPTPANPWRVLVELHLSSGKMDEALSALSEMLRWNDRQPASLRDQSRAENEAMVALVLMVAGENEMALERIDRAIERPDRRGLTTDGAEVQRGRHALLRRIIRRSLLEQRAEEASWTGRGAQLLDLFRSIPDRFAGTTDEERIVAVLTDEERLIATMRPYMQGGITGLSPWLIGELTGVLGTEITEAAFEEACYGRDNNAAATDAYAAMYAELQLADGDERETISTARRVMPQLEGAGWALLRARLAALAALAAEAIDDRASANELFTVALETDPGLLRRMGIALPVAFEGSGGDDVEEAIDWLERSPRFRSEDGAFVVAVTETPAGLRACLRSANGNEIRCADAPRALPENAPEEDAELTIAQRLARETHRQLFSARLDPNTIDLGSLDGRTNGGSSVANERLREMMQTPP